MNIDGCTVKSLLWISISIVVMISLYIFHNLILERKLRQILLESASENQTFLALKSNERWHSFYVALVLNYFDLGFNNLHWGLQTWKWNINLQESGVSYHLNVNDWRFYIKAELSFVPIVNEKMKMAEALEELY